MDLSQSAQMSDDTSAPVAAEVSVAPAVPVDSVAAPAPVLAVTTPVASAPVTAPTAAPAAEGQYRCLKAIDWTNAEGEDVHHEPGEIATVPATAVLGLVAGGALDPVRVDYEPPVEESLVVPDPPVLLPAESGPETVVKT